MQQAVARNLRAFKTKCLDVNFDLDNSEYRAVQNIGTGAYGVVCSATHKKTSEKVAIKKIPNAFEELTTAKRTYRELKIMRHFRHENVIGIREILMPKEPLNDLRDVYVVLDLMESDLHHIIHSQQSVSMEHIRYFLYQLLRGLKYIHSANVVHRDLKPSNLLVNENCELKIGDFGMARGLSGSSDPKRKMFMTVYVATRWYRAPELLFSNEDYSYAVDMWSVGCIFAEMLGRKQIFPGKNPMHQLTLIIEVLGMPPDSLLRSTNSDQIFNFFHRNFGGKQSTNLRDKYPNLDEDGKDLLSKMLVFNPSDRISVKEALSHPFLAKYHDPDDEPECFPTFDFSFEQEDLTKQQIRQNVGKMILKYQRTKLFAGKKFPGSFSVVKPSTATTASSAAFQETKSAIMPPAGKTASPANALPVANPPDTPQRSDPKGPPKEGIFKVPSIPGDEKKSLTPESKPNRMVSEAEETLSVIAVATLSVSNDVHMKSATRSAQNSAIGNADGLVPNMTALKTLTAPSSHAVSGDVEMRSAHGEQKQPLAGSGMGPSLPESQDVDMRSARQGAETDSVTIRSQVKDSLDNSQHPQPCVVAEVTGQKMVSDDTKELIKAALRQSVLKNKMRKESEFERGGGKVPVTAAARQREREQKRRQKLRWSLERQKKGKGKGKRSTADANEEDKHQLLTDEDRNMLERWNKMLKKKDPEEPVESDKSGDDGGLAGTEQGNVAQDESLLARKSGESKFAVSAAPADPSQTTHRSGRSSVTELAEPVSSMASRISPRNQDTAPAGQTVGPKVPISGAVEAIQAPPQQQLPGLGNAASAPKLPIAVASQAQQNPYVCVAKTAPSSRNNFGTSSAQLYVGQPTSQSMNSNPNHSFYAQSDGEASSGVVASEQTGELQMSALAGSANHPPASGDESATAQLLVRYPMAASSSAGFQLGQSVDNSGFQQYRSRHYSDRETPSPPHNVQQSPPAYTSPTGNPNRYPYKHTYVSPGRQSPGRQDALPAPSRPSPTLPELAQVIRQLSKSAMEDSLPPILQVTPKGDGAGYGLSMDLEDWLESSLGSPSGASKLDSGPLSASLLSDWLEVRDMNMDDMMAVQQELGLASPFNLSDIPGLVESPKKKDRV